MIRNLQRLPVAQRRLVFFLIFFGVILALILITLLLAGQALNSGPRLVSTALVPEVTVRQFAVLPDDDAYPPAVVAAPDGTVYTGSYASGAIWAIDRDGHVTEMPGTREAIGAVTGLAVAPDGALLVVDQGDTDPRTAGGVVQRLAPAGTVSVYATLNDGRGFIAPNDIAFDSAGAFYVTDPGRSEVWRFVVSEDGTPQGQLWWAPSAAGGSPRSAITGLAYDTARDSLIVTDPETNRIYRIAIAGKQTEVIYDHGTRPNAPGFDGAAVGPDGTLYVAAFGQNGIAIVQDNDLDYIAGLFRGSSDVEYAYPNRLYVANFDQTSLVLPLVHPQLPFALDVIELNPFEVTPSAES